MVAPWERAQARRSRYLGVVATGADVMIEAWSWTKKLKSDRRIDRRFEIRRRKYVIRCVFTMEI